MLHADRLVERLKKLEVGKYLTLQLGALTQAQQQACYRAAKRARVRVSVRTLPSRVIAIRLS